MGWLPSNYRRWGCMLRFWNRLIKMNDNRLTKTVFNVDYNKCENNWAYDIKQVMQKIGLTHHFDNKSTIDLTLANNLLTEHYSNAWYANVQTTPKLRSYKLFKSEFTCEDYVKMNLMKNERSLLCQFRSGILPLRLETGRYVGETPEQRLCRFCTDQSVEDERHFLLTCSMYSNIRDDIFHELLQDEHFINSTSDQKLSQIINSRPRKAATFLVRAYTTRASHIFI